MKGLPLFIASLVALAGCATPEYYAAEKERVLAWERVEIAKANARNERYKALVAAAQNGSDIARVAVAMAVNNDGAGGVNYASPMPAPLPAPDEQALRWASIIMPNVTTIALGAFNKSVQMNASDNARMVVEASYGTMASLGTTGMGTMRDVAIAGFNAFTSLPPSSTTTNTTTVTAGTGSVVAWGGGTATLDQARRCSPTLYPVDFAGAIAAPITLGAPFTC